MLKQFGSLCTISDFFHGHILGHDIRLELRQLVLFTFDEDPTGGLLHLALCYTHSARFCFTSCSKGWLLSHWQRLGCNSLKRQSMHFGKSVNVIHSFCLIIRLFIMVRHSLLVGSSGSMAPASCTNDV